MKLLSGTSFFFLCILLCLFSFSCKKDDKISQRQGFQLSKEAFALKENMLTCSKEGKYELAIYYTEKLLNYAKFHKDTLVYKIAYDKLSSCYFSLHRSDLAIYYTDKLQEIAEKTKDTLRFIKAKWKKGYYYKKVDSLKLAYSNYNEYKKINLSLGNKTKAGRALLEIANIFRKQGYYGISQLSATEGLDYLKDSDNLSSISGLYQSLAASSKETGKYKTAEEYINKALLLTTDSIARKKIGIENIVIFKNTKANIFKATKRYDEAIAIYNELLKQKEGDTLEIKRIHSNLAYTLYLKNGFNKRSDSLLRDALLYIKATQKTSALLSVQLNLAKIYQYEDKKMALKYADLALKTAEKKNNLSSIYEALEVKINNSHNVEDVDRFIAVGKELKRREEDLNYLYIHERYNYDKVEKERIKAENIASRRQNFILLLSLILLAVLVVTFFIYQQIQRRHKIEKVKTVHNTEARISTKVHDELANDIHNLLAQVETSDPDKSMLLDKLDTIYHNARDISKQNRSIETGEGFSNELANLFRSYQSDKVNIILKKYNTVIWNGISAHVKVTIYRVLQELLTNMKKHSNATLVAVTIEKINKELFIQFKDNGKGFSDKISKNGLLNAENRIRAIKGTLTFDTELHQGCKFNINVPL